MKSSLFAAGLLLSGLGGACLADSAPPAAPAGAQGAAPPVASATAISAAVQTASPQGPASPPKICKWTEELGTRLGRTKVCLTRADWDRQARDAQDDLNDTTQRSLEGSPPGR